MSEMKMFPVIILIILLLSGCKGDVEIENKEGLVKRQLLIMSEAIEQNDLIYYASDAAISRGIPGVEGGEEEDWKYIY